MQFYKATLTYANPTNNVATLSTFTPVSMTSGITTTPIRFEYYSYTNKFPFHEMNTPEQKLVYTTDKGNTLNIVGAKDDLTTKPTQITLPSTIGQAVSFSCGDTDASGYMSTPITQSHGTCYLLTNNSQTTSKPEYHAYKITDIDPDAHTPIKPASIIEITFKSPIPSINKAIIDGNTGSLLTMDSNNNVALYILSNGAYGAAQVLTLPPASGSKTAQVASNIFEY